MGAMIRRARFSNGKLSDGHRRIVEAAPDGGHAPQIGNSAACNQWP